MAEKKEVKTKATKTAVKKPAAAKAPAKASKPKLGKTAILAINQMQYVVREGETIETRITLGSTDKDVEVKLLAVVDGENIEYGKPHLSNKIDFTIGEQVSGEKVVTSRYKAKARNRRKVGFRPKYMEFTLNSVK